MNIVVFIVPRLSRKRGKLKLICPSVCHKILNLAHIFWNINDTLALIFGMHDPSMWQVISIGTMRWPWPFTYFKVKYVALRGTTIFVAPAKQSAT